jgi:hypothetical protein
MKKFLTIAVAGVLLLAGGSVAYANICAFDPVPAATLLFPFAAYNYDEGVEGVNTLFSITNVSSDAQIVHVTLWTDYSVPVIDWNVLLTGYDVYTFDVRSILKDGMIPPSFIRTAGVDDGVLDQGPVSNNNPAVTNQGGPEWYGPFDKATNDTGMAWPEPTQVFESGNSFVGCDKDVNEAYPGLFDGFVIDDGILGFFQSLLQGSQGGNNEFNDCAGNDYSRDTWFDSRSGSDDTFMYITADVVNTCNKLFPDEEDYWLAGVVENYNVLIGEVIWLNKSKGYSEISNAVQIEASDNLGAVVDDGPNGYPFSFYGRYSNAAGEEDYREPLPTAWAVRYLTGTAGGGDTLSTMIRAFKASNRTEFPIVPDLDVTLLPPNNLVSSLVSRNCLAYTLYIWDEEENIDYSPVDDPPYSGGEEEIRGVQPNLLPLETQEVSAEEFNLVNDNGWMLFVWPASNLAVDYQAPGDPELYYQTWMGVKYITEGADGGFSGAKDGHVLANFNCFEEQRLDWGLGINFEYVDGGGYVRWTGSSE